MASTLIGDWCHKIIHGCGGVDDYEHYEKVVYSDRDVAIVEFVCRALANPKCEGSQEVLDAICKRRTEAGGKPTL